MLNISLGRWWNDKEGGTNSSTFGEETCSGATLSTTNTTCTNMGSNRD